MLPIWLLAAMMIMMYYWRFWEPWANAMLAILLPKLWFGLKTMTGTTVFACLPGAHPYWTQKSQNEQFYIIDWIRKKLLVDVANLAPCCHDDYDVLLEVLGTLGKCYASNPVAKTLVWIENHDWHNCFCMSSWGSPLLDPKKLQNEQFYIIDWIRRDSWSMLPIWLLAAMMIMMYYWRFWEPWANAMLAILLPKLWFGLKIMTGTTVFACLPGAHPYWTQKSFKTNSFT